MAASVEIITHCWNYSRLLTYQLSSILLYPPDTATLVTVFATKTDTATVDTVRWFGKAGVNVKLWLLPEAELKNRSIGRNLAARNTEAAVVWFTDADYLFGDGAINALGGGVGRKLYRPQLVKKQVAHASGDAYIARVTEPKPYAINPLDFTPTRVKRAIGGVQIVSGETARRWGYLPTSKKHQAPYNGEHFKQSISDRAYRKELAAGGVDTSGKLFIPNVYRLRHSESGVQARRGVGRRRPGDKVVKL